jgi:uncharacterized protein YsxB (DUF464 family)
MEGHADYAKSGQDIVCAAASSIAYTTENAISRFNPDAIEANDEDGYMLIKVLSDNRETQLLLENMIDLFKQLTRDYPNYIKILN